MQPISSVSTLRKIRKNAEQIKREAKRPLIERAPVGNSYNGRDSWVIYPILLFCLIFWSFILNWIFSLIG